MLLACGDRASAPAEPVDPPRAEDSAPPAEPAPADPLRFLTRASIVLRGVRPSAAEYAQATDLATAGDLAATWLDDPRFGRQVAELWADRLLTRVDEHFLQADDVGLVDEAEWVQAIGDQPIEVVRYIAEHDLPWTEVVTADWTVASPQLTAAWPLEPVAEGWEQSRWTDGRPAVGLLASTALWWRYDSTESNANRGRASATARIFLCHDFLEDPIPFDRGLSLLDEEAVRDAIATNDACVACHVALDPLAAHYFGFLYRFEESPYDRARYHPDREDDYADHLDADPGYYGVPTEGLYDLGTHVADDPRFVSCAVETVYAGVLGRPTTSADQDALSALREAFLDGGLGFRALYRALLADPTFQSAEPRLVTPEQLASTVEGLTGYRGTRQGWDLFRTDQFGFRLLAGGVDGLYTTAPAGAPIPTLVLVQQRLAEVGAGRAVDRARAGETDLFGGIDLDVPPEPAAEAAVLADLALAVTGEAWSAGELAALSALRAEVAATDGEAEGWRAALTALLRDPRFLVY